MRKALLLFLTAACAAAAFGQPLVGPEILSDPISPASPLESFAAPAVAMARDAEGVAIAWMMRDAAFASRIYVGRLDPSGHLRQGTMHELPLGITSERVDAVYPSIASLPSGGFIVAWTEIVYFTQSSKSASFCRLDSAMNPSAASVVAGATLPMIVRSSNDVWLASARTIWHLGADGPEVRGATISVSDMAIAAQQPWIVSSRRVRLSEYECRPNPECRVQAGPFRGSCYDECRIYRHNFALDFGGLGASHSMMFPFDSSVAPAIHADGSDVVIAWFRGGQTEGGDVVLSRVSVPDGAVESALQQAKAIGPFAPDQGATRPDIASDGQRLIVVWRTKSPLGNHDVVGASIDREGTVRAFSIATSPADERDPSIISLGPGSFLVAYETLSAGERRIAGRFVTFSGKRHSAR